MIDAWRLGEAELRRFLRHQLHDADLADDLLQEVFIKAMRQGEAFCRIDNARAWLYQVARNAVVDSRRTARPHEPLPDDLAVEPADSAPVESLASCLPRALAALDDDDRDAISHCDLQGMPQRDYAVLRGLSVPGAKSRVQRARARLRGVLVDLCGVRFDAQTGQVCCHRPPSREGGSTP